MGVFLTIYANFCTKPSNRLKAISINLTGKRKLTYLSLYFYLQTIQLPRLIHRFSSVAAPSLLHRCSIESMDNRWTIDGASSYEERTDQDSTRQCSSLFKRCIQRRIFLCFISVFSIGFIKNTSLKYQ